MPELVLVEAPDGTDFPPDQLSRWAGDLHDQLDSRDRPTAADRQRVTSWLRVQAVGRTTVTVTDARVDTYAGLWAAAAQAAGLSTRLVNAAGQSRQPTPDSSLTDPTATAPSSLLAAVDVDDRWRARTKVWLFDRAEAVGRVAVRAIQR